MHGNPCTEVIEAKRRLIVERRAGETITSALHRGFLAAIEVGVPQLMADGASFLRTIDGSPALRARARLGFQKAEALLDLQKKVSEILGIVLPPPPIDEGE